MTSSRSSRDLASKDRRDDVDALAAECAVVPFSVGGLRGLVIDVPVEPDDLPACLTSSEREVVTLILAGMSSQQIAERRRRSYRTVANQLAAVYRKLQVAGRAELVARFGPSLD